MPTWVQRGLILQSSGSHGQGSATNIRIIQYDEQVHVVPVKHIDSYPRPREIESLGIGPRSVYFQNNKKQTANKRRNKPTLRVSGGQPGLITTVYYWGNAYYRCPCRYPNALITIPYSDQLTDL